MSLVLAAALVTVAVQALAPPRRPSPAAPGAPAPRRWRPAWQRMTSWLLARRASARRGTDLGAILTEVAARLRAGADAHAAWAAALARAPGLEAGREPTLDAEGVPTALLPGRGGAHERGPAAAAVAACRLTHELGAPLAQMLEQCAEAVSELGRASAARSVALAGPRSTARLLGWLPLLGLVVGALLGADPVGVLLDGAVGTACLLLGAVLIAVGHRWSARLMRAAEHAR